MSAVFIDSSSNNLPLTNTAGSDGGVTYDVLDPVVGFADGVFGNSQLTTPLVSALNLATGDFTIEFWIINGFQAGEAEVVSLGNINGGTDGIVIVTALLGGDPTKPLLFVEATEIGGSQVIASSDPTSSPFNKAVWNHFAAVMTGGALLMYVNGVVADSEVITTLETFTTAGLFIGGASPGPLNGRIDELRISNIARYTGNFTPPTAPFVSDANTVALLHMEVQASTPTVQVQGRFVGPPAASKAILTASPGTINPRVYIPEDDTTARVPQPRLPL